MKDTMLAILVGTIITAGLIGYSTYPDKDRVVIDEYPEYQVVAYGQDVYVEGSSIYGNIRTQLTNKKTGEPITYDEYMNTHEQILTN
jgi:hypothetical protein